MGCSDRQNSAKEHCDHASKVLGELGVAVQDQEAEAAGPAAEIHDQVAGLLSGPHAIRLGGHAQDVHPPRPHLHDNSTYRRLRKIVST